jgi:glycosyltransferase involved in cell wall biosynthesis
MGNEKIKVLHVDTELTWRGGQQQAIYLFQSMCRLLYDSLMICQPGSAIEKYCIDHKLPYHSLKFSNELDFVSGLKLSMISHKYKTTILHLHSGHSVSWGLWAKLFNPKLKLIVTRRVDFSIRKNIVSLFKYNNRFINKIVCISEKIQEVLINDGIKKEKLVVIRSGIDVDKFTNLSRNSAFRKRWGIPEDSILIGTVAALVGHKDYPNLLNAAKIVCNTYDNVYFMAVGDGELLQSMKSLAITLGIEKRFIFTGFQKQVPEFLIEFDIFVLASKMEGLGTSVLDAMAAGLPIVATQAGGIPEMINHNINGYLVDVNDSISLAHGITILIQDKTLRDLMISNSKSLVMNFHKDITCASNLKLYREVLNDKV